MSQDSKAIVRRFAQERWGQARSRSLTTFVASLTEDSRSGPGPEAGAGRCEGTAVAACDRPRPATG